MKEPDQYTVLGAIALANRAPSAHNTQPWRWLLGEESVHLMADRGRRVPTTDHAERDLLLSCGAALHHLRVALAAFGWRAVVRHVPNPGDPDHLAAVGFAPWSTPSTEVVTLAGTISRRRTDRRRVTARPVPDGHLDLMVDRAVRAGAQLVRVTDRVMRERLTHAIDETTPVQPDDHAVAPADRPVGTAVAYGDTRTRPSVPVPFADTKIRPATVDHGELLVLASCGEDPASVLRAGEAASAALLTAASVGLATYPVSQVFETAAARAELGEKVLGGTACPQLVLRTGWAPSPPTTPTSPRRATSDTVGYLPGIHRPAHIPPPRPMS